jgi:hypothetical protein
MRHLGGVFCVHARRADAFVQDQVQVQVQVQVWIAAGRLCRNPGATG